MGTIQTAVQQIMLGSVIKKETDAKAALAAVRAAGFDAVELNGFMIHETGLLVRLMTRAAGMPVGKGGSLAWKVLVKEAGLSVSSLHTDLGSVKRDPAAVAAEAKDFGTKYVVITGMYRFDYTDRTAVKGLAKDLNESGKRLSAEGVSLLYHNHNCEFLRFPQNTAAAKKMGASKNAALSGNTPSPESTGLSESTFSPKNAYELLLTETDPRYVNFELDTYWATETGVDPKLLMELLGERMKLWHINDRGSKAAGTLMTPIVTSDSMELGTGNMDLTGLMTLAKKNGVETIVLESHRNFIDKDSLKSIAVSGAWLREHIS